MLDQGKGELKTSKAFWCFTCPCSIPISKVILKMDSNPCVWSETLVPGCKEADAISKNCSHLSGLREGLN